MHDVKSYEIESSSMPRWETNEAFFLLYRKDRLRRSLELKRARTEAGTTSRRMLV